MVHLLKRWEMIRNSTSQENSDLEMANTEAEEVATMTMEVSLDILIEEETSTLIEVPEVRENIDHLTPLRSPKVLIDLALVSRSSEAIVV